jgi:hypothetical protein
MARKKTEAAAPAPAGTPSPGAAPQGNGREKTKCPLTRQAFLENAGPLTVVIDGKSVEVEVKEFATGSFGWYFSGRVTVEVGGVRLPVQVGLNLTAIGSKEAVDF